MTCYLIHLNENLAHARHYIGFTEGYPHNRLKEHKVGLGARMLEVCNERGIDYDIVRTWKGDRKLERRLKNRKNAAKLCPICNKFHNAKK